nr:uncharacterized protein LOC109154433 [Ipomoea trifida]
MSDSPTNQISMQGMQQMIEELMATQEARLQSQWKDQLLTFMAATEAKWQAGADKGKAPARTEAGAETSLAKRDDNGDLTTNRDKEGGLTDEVLMAMKPSSKRLDVPKFDGADPKRWIFNIQEYFNFHQTPEPQRLQIAGLCLEGDASEWFRWMKQNRMLYGWHDFLEKVEQRFGMMQFEDPLADLAKLTFTQVPSKTTIPAFSNSTRPTGNIVQGLLPAPKITQPSTTNTTLPIRKFSAPEIREWRDNGLCFHCDERYSPGHRCKGRFLLLIGDEDEDHLEGETINKEDNNLEGEVVSGDISTLNTMTGPSSPRSLHIVGKIKKRRCLVLIDSGSTHNFINPTIVEKLQLPVNGNTLGWQYVCPAVEIHMQDVSFTVDLHVLRIIGPDVVFGVQWLQGLGTVTHDYSQMTMEFIKDSKKVKLQGESVLHHPPISFNQLQAIADNGDIQAAYEIHQLSSTETKTTLLELLPIPKELPEAFQQLLLEFSSIFEPLNTLPPHRKFDHNIHLLPNTKPVNIRPYRYPYFQKSEIEKLSDTFAQLPLP